MRIERGKARVHHIAVRQHLAVLDEMALVIESRAHRLRRLVVARRARADGPEVVEERATERRVEEIVREYEFPGVFPDLELAALVVSPHKPAGVALRYELVHLPAVDLRDLVEIGVDRAGIFLIERNVLVHVERSVG